MVAATRRLLRDDHERDLLGRTAQSVASGYSWRTASTSVLQLLSRAVAGLEPTDAVDPTSAPRVVDLTRAGRSLHDGLPDDVAPGADRVIDLREDVHQTEG